MGIKINRTPDELHPEGLFLFCIIDAAESKGKFGLQVRWKMQSTEQDENGNPFELFYYTGLKLSRHPECKIVGLIEACGLSTDDFEDTDELIDMMFCGRVEHSDDGMYANIVKVFPKSKLEKAKPAAKAKSRMAPASNDPFEEE